MKSISALVSGDSGKDVEAGSLGAVFARLID